MSKYQTAPTEREGIPAGIPYIVANEAAERFSFYGMKGILVIFMTKFLVDSTGQSDVMSPEAAKAWYHSFTSAVYFFPLLGAILSDWLFGKYRTILWLSLVYCLGHLSLAFMDVHHPLIQGLMEPRDWLLVGLILISVGSGGIKPCVSAHVGDQFGQRNAHLMQKIFGWFYFSINLGAFVSTLLTPILLNHPDYGPAWAFGIPGVLMGIATVFFWMGRHTFIHIPAGGTAFFKELFSAEGFGALSRLFVIYLFVAMFWALFDQTGSAWVLQAEQMDRNFLGFEWHSSQIQAINPIMIMVFIPIFNGVKLKSVEVTGIYGLIDKAFTLTPLRKIGIGFFLTVPAFLLPAWIQSEIDSGAVMNISWQLLAYVIMTAAEVFVSITCLEFSYTQAPKKMKSIVMATYLLSVSLGNIFVTGVNIFIQTDAPSFEADRPGEYVVELTGTDSAHQVSDKVTIQVYADDAGPIALEEEAPQLLTVDTIKAVRPGETVTVFAQNLMDSSDGTPQYEWFSDHTALKIDAPNTPYAVVQSAVEGEFPLGVRMTVGDQAVVKYSTVVVTKRNWPPVVNAGPDQQVNTGTVTLNGEGSQDLFREAVKWKWSLIQKPDGSQATVENQTSLTSGTKLTETEYYLFFSVLMFITAVLFIPYAMVFKERTYIQDSVADTGAE
ncbi:MAG: MFS transporter [Myxococcota bacterium]|nr:MFS transporter [Myxococcota bacterium]